MTPSDEQTTGWHSVTWYDFVRYIILLLLPLVLQPIAGFGLSNNTSPFFPIYHQLSPSSLSQHLKISFYFFSPSFSGSPSLSRPFQFLSEYFFGHPIFLHSLQVTQPRIYVYEKHNLMLTWATTRSSLRHKRTTGVLWIIIVIDPQLITDYLKQVTNNWITKFRGISLQADWLYFSKDDSAAGNWTQLTSNL